jgi:hypothetical protein
MSGWIALPLEKIPRVPNRDPGPAWYPLQHLFGLSAFGANAFVSGDAGETLVEEHTEDASDQEELYLVLRGRARFTIAGESTEAAAITVIAVRDPSLTRSAVALEPGTALLAIGGVPSDEFRSTWLDQHFSGIDPLL